MGTERFEAMLSGGRPNSLGRTEEVVAAVLVAPKRLDEVVACYQSEDELVRLRTSSTLKRIAREELEWLVPYLDRFVGDISKIDQASIQWTMADLFRSLAPYMSAAQKKAASAIMKKNLERDEDWIVLNSTMLTLADWAESDARLRRWLIPQLEQHATDVRKSVSGRAQKLAASLSQR